MTCRFSAIAMSIGLIAGGCSQPAIESTSGAVDSPPSLQGALTEQTVVVQLDASEVDALHIETHEVTLQELAHQIEVPGEVMPSPEHFSLVSAPISGRIVSIAAHEGEAVRQGQLLFEMESLEFAELVADYLQARTSVAYEETQLARTRQLVSENITAQRTLEQREAELKQARASLAASLARLQAVGLSRQEVEQWIDDGPDSYAALRVRSPITGYIDEHEIELGQAVTAYDKLLSIVDPGFVLVKGYAPPAEAVDMHAGDRVLVKDRQAADRQIQARIATINPSLDADNKSVVLNVLMPAEEGWPMPGNLVSMVILHQQSTPEMIVPLSAVQYEGNRPTVFVKLSPDSYEKRFIEIGRVDQDYLVVKAGLSAGDQVAITQVFNLKAISRFEQYGEE